MATILDKTTSNINPFTKTRFDLGLGTGTLPKKLTPVDRFLDSKLKEKQYGEQRINELCEELSKSTDLSIDEDTVKKWIKKTGAYYKLETYIRFESEITRGQNQELINIWDNAKVDCYCEKCTHDPAFHGGNNMDVFWTKKDGDRRLFTERVKIGKVYRKDSHGFDHYVEPQKTHDRNQAIAEIRDKYLSRTKRGLKYYEMQANYYYESPEAYQAFLKEVEQKGLVRKAEKKKLGDNTKQLFELGLIKGINTEGLDEDNIYSFRDLNRFQKEEVLD